MHDVRRAVARLEISETRLKGIPVTAHRVPGVLYQIIIMMAGRPCRDELEGKLVCYPLSPGSIYFCCFLIYHVSKTVILRRYFESWRPFRLIILSRLKMLHGVNRRYVRESYLRVLWLPDPPLKYINKAHGATGEGIIFAPAFTPRTPVIPRNKTHAEVMTPSHNTYGCSCHP